MEQEQKLDYAGLMKAGRRTTFDSVEELQGLIIKYLTEGRKVKQIFVGGEPYYVPILTITGLSLYLGFESRQSFYDYEKRGEKEEATTLEQEFSYTMKKARTFIEEEYESQLQSGNTSGAIFALKNFGWKDIQTHEGELNDNGDKTFKMIYEEAKHSKIDENGDTIQ